MTISLPYYQVRAPEDYRLTFRTPSGCNISNCTSFVGIDVNAGNGAFLDIYMEGEAQGWVGVGFSVTRDMVSGRHVYTVFMLIECKPKNNFRSHFRLIRVA